MFSSTTVYLLAIANIAFIAALPTPHVPFLEVRTKHLPQDQPGSSFSGAGGQAGGGSVNQNGPNTHWVEILSNNAGNAGNANSGSSHAGPESTVNSKSNNDGLLGGLPLLGGDNNNGGLLPGLGL
ncbi:hypothetical protein CYLTODRAFT_488717 [Cylindrobasidium torrendii FP15055 ss-10]|uniref:Uncharacterized protein n=1 Tax=Cylindrobasidium torrendii FP15055 ss-10 TaxID=1314674 RepID=A0A0D7BHI1_9AGAR|nr:hypothetical protein CYLTODRAFT_488717 [Cylindrobasidium torrendii FP15055 ss-10]